MHCNQSSTAVFFSDHQDARGDCASVWAVLAASTSVFRQLGLPIGFPGQSGELLIHLLSLAGDGQQLRESDHLRFHEQVFSSELQCMKR